MSKPRFAPMPARAARDLRLAARHWRVLAAIGLHDQLNKNGSGCWVAHKQLARFAGIDQTELSHVLIALREWGYIVSMISPQDLRRRIHRINYIEADHEWHRDSCPPAQASTCAPAQASEAHSWKNQGKYLGNAAALVGKTGHQTDPTPLKSLSENDRTYVQHIEHIKKEGLVEGTDCAEARLAMKVREAQEYLADLEALAASGDHDQIRFERAVLRNLATDARLPEAMNERAAKLLCQIGFS